MRRRVGRVASSASLLLTLATFLVGVPTRAQDDSESTPAPPTPVRITLVTDGPKPPELKARIASWFQPEQYAVTVDYAQALDSKAILNNQTNSGVQVWIHLAGDSTGKLFFVLAQRDGPRFLLRDVPFGSDVDDVGAEQLAAVVHLSVGALLSGDKNSRTEVEHSLKEVAPAERAPSPGEVPAPRAQSAKQPSSWFVRAGAGYGARYRGDEGIGHGPRLAAELGTNHWVLTLLGHSALSTTERFGPTDIELSAWGGALLGGWQHALTHGWGITLQAGPAFEMVRFEATSTDSAGIALGGSKTDLRPLGLAAGSLTTKLSAVRVALRLEAWLHLSDTHYDINRADGDERLGGPLPIMPGAAVEVLF